MTFFPWPNSSQWPGPLHYPGLTVIVRRATFGRTSDKADAGTFANTQHSQETSMPPAGFEPRIPSSEHKQTEALDRVAATVG